MSSNPFMDYQEQFFKLWNSNMEKMMDSDAYKNMAKNIPGADLYTKTMESMVPNVENYWKTMFNAMPGMNAEKKEEAPASPMMEYWNNMTKQMQNFAGMMPDMSEYWKNFTKGMPDMSGFWKSFTNMMPDMSNVWGNYWDAFAKMMPNPEKFANMAPFKIPGLDGFTKVFDLWKSFGDPTAFAKDFQEKYMDITADVIKGLFPENIQPFVAKPMDFMNTMVEYYKQFVSPWMEIDPEIMNRIGQGDMKAYVDFFKDYQKKYEESIEKYFNVMGMGLNREANEDYMKALNTYNKAMISMGELMAVITETSVDSMNQIGEKIQEDLDEGKSLTTFRDFYNVWYSVTEAAFEKLLATDEFAKVFDEFSDKYAQYMIAQNKVYERMLAFLPIPTNTDMKSLYKTVYDLRKEVRDLKKALAAMEEKKGDK